MHPVRKRRLITVIFIIIASSVAVGLVVFALNENMNLFYPPSQIVAGDAPIGRTIRAGGCVVPGSVVREDVNLKVRFDITDGAAKVNVGYEGILPDLFAEGEAAVVIGKLLDDGSIMASQVLAKHDETYMPREVADSMSAAKADYKDDAEICGAINYAP